MLTSKDITAAPLRRKALIAVAGLALAMPAAGVLAGTWFGGEEVKGSGVARTQARNPGSFSGFSLSIPANAQVVIGNTEGITIEADDNLLPLIETVVEKGVLKVRPVREKLHLRAKTLRITVNARQINNLTLGGAGTINSAPLRAERISLSVGGSGTIEVGAVDAERVDIAVGGSGDIKVGGGQAGRLSLTIGGSGDVDAGAMKAADVGITVGGSGTSTVWATNRLNYTIAGSGDVRYYGDPRISRTVVGSGDAERLGAAPR